MPIFVDAEIRRMSQVEFGDIAYHVMQRVFRVHQQLGRFFNENVYQQAIAGDLNGAQVEVPIRVVFEGFRKEYFLDLLVQGGAAFELKAVERLTGRHPARRQCGIGRSTYRSAGDAAGGSQCCVSHNANQRFGTMPLISRACATTSQSHETGLPAVDQSHSFRGCVSDDF